MPRKLQAKGRWPRVNLMLVAETDYADSAGAKAKDGHPAGGPVRLFRMHLEVDLRAAEAARLQRELARPGPLAKAHRVVRGAMDRVVPPRDPTGRRGRAFMAAAFSGSAGRLKPKGRWPRVNFIVATDYVDAVAVGAPAPTPRLNVHLDVEVTRSEAAELARLLGAPRARLRDAQKVVEGAMGRVVAAADPLGRRGRALVRAAFSR